MLGNEFSIWAIDSDGVREQESFDCDGWGPGDVRWISDEEIVFKKSPNGIDPENAGGVKDSRAIRKDGDWLIED